ncbi:response regulator [Rhodanobacter sp. 115]|uniref:response regulator n=1 Tax=Rhodanobacter sp. FW021-MT20 TaxID=1162282 RepID=UPI0034E53FFC
MMRREENENRGHIATHRVTAFSAQWGAMDAIAPHHERDGFAFVVADDHPSVAMAVCQICESRLGVAREQFVTAQCSRTLLELCSKASPLPRIIVLDLVMPGDLKRAALVRAVHDADRSARLVVYSADESPFLVKAVTRAGAMAYVSKSSSTSVLVDAILAVSEGRTYTDSRIDFSALENHPWVSLTESERSVLLAFSRGRNANEIVAATGRSYSTVTTHKYNGLQKLQLRDVTGLVPYLYENGLTCELDDDGPLNPDQKYVTHVS